MGHKFLAGGRYRPVRLETHSLGKFPAAVNSKVCANILGSSRTVGGPPPRELVGLSCSIAAFVRSFSLNYLHLSVDLREGRVETVFSIHTAGKVIFGPIYCRAATADM